MIYKHAYSIGAKLAEQQHYISTTFLLEGEIEGNATIFMHSTFSGSLGVQYHATDLADCLYAI